MAARRVGNDHGTPEVQQLIGKIRMIATMRMDIDVLATSNTIG
jgi:hypothetical protein